MKKEQEQITLDEVSNSEVAEKALASAMAHLSHMDSEEDDDEENY